MSSIPFVFPPFQAWGRMNWTPGSGDRGVRCLSPSPLDSAIPVLTDSGSSQNVALNKGLNRVLIQNVTGCGIVQIKTHKPAWERVLTNYCSNEPKCTIIL